MAKDACGSPCRRTDMPESVRGAGGNHVILTAGLEAVTDATAG